MRKCSRRLRISKRPKMRSSRGNKPSGVAIRRGVVTVRHRRRCRNGGGRDEAVRGGVGGDERVGADAGGRAAARQRQRFVLAVAQVAVGFLAEYLLRFLAKFPVTGLGRYRHTVSRLP